MPMPKSVTKIDKDGVKFIDNVDATQYTLKELIRAANRDVGKFVAKTARDNVYNDVDKRTGKGKGSIQYWNRKGVEGEQPHVLIGYKGKHRGFYLWYFEVGSHDMPKYAVLTNTVEQNIDKIRQIQGQYLSAIADANKAAGLIDESEEISDDS